MADRGRILVSVVVNKRDEITRKLFNVIFLQVIRIGRVAIATLIGDDNMIVCSDKGGG